MLWFVESDYRVKMALTFAIFPLIALKGIRNAYENRQKNILKSFWSLRLQNFVILIFLFFVFFPFSVFISHFHSFQFSQAFPLYNFLLSVFRSFTPHILHSSFPPSFLPSFLSPSVFFLFYFVSSFLCFFSCIPFFVPSFVSSFFQCFLPPFFPIILSNRRLYTYHL